MISINETIENAYEKWKNKDYIFEKKDNEFKAIKFGEFLRKVNSLAHELIRSGLKDQKIIVFGPNSIYYMITDLAILAYVGTCVNINCQTGKEELLKIIDKLGIEAIIYDERQAALFTEIKKENNNVNCMGMQTIINKLPDEEPIFDFNDKDVNSCSKIIYSSGTTSEPKGIMLSLKNIFSGWEPLQRRTPFNEKDSTYLFLPLHHTYANIYNFIYSLLSGISIYLCSGIENIESELKEVNPTIFCGVPLIYKKIYANNLNTLNTAFGNNIKYLYCGGTKFDPAIRKIYKTAGLPMFEAYALTETASSFSIEYPNNDDFESAGTVFENIDVRIIDKNKDGIGEITVKGDNVFLGYVNNEELTKKSFTNDGYFLTNDYGYIKDNKLYVVGRKSDIIIGENGENVYPKEIEKLLKEYSPDILKIQAFLKDSKVNYKIYIKEGSSINIEDIITNYNSKVTKKDNIKFYEIKYTSQINLK